MFGWLRREMRARRRQHHALDLAREARDLREYSGGDRRPLGSVWADLVSNDALAGPTRRLRTVPLRGAEPRSLAQAPTEPIVAFRDGVNRAATDDALLVRPYTSHRLPD